MNTTPLPHATEPAEAPFSPVHFSSRSIEWYTPRHVVDRVVTALGGIDLDPCSNSRRTPVVPATRHFTVKDNGLARPWTGHVFMNPPYGHGVLRWVEKLCHHHECGDVPAAITLLHARTDTRWFARLQCYAKCFVRGRLTFAGGKYPAPFPSVLIYLGPSVERFADAFSDLGDLHVPLSRVPHGRVRSTSSEQRVRTNRAIVTG